MKKILKRLSKIGNAFISFINKFLVVPISKLLFIFNKKFDKPGKQIENWLSKTNTLLFTSLIFSVGIFIYIDSQIESYAQSSAQILYDQKVSALYDQDNYVVEGFPEDVDITLIGNTVDLYIASQSPTNEVTLDLWGLKPGKHEVALTYNKAGGNIKYTVNPSFATVIIYEKISTNKTLSVDILNQDNLDDKFIIDEVTLKETEAVIKGASYKIESVATVKALLDVDILPEFQLGQTITTSVPLKAYDEEGNVVDVEISPSRVDVEVTVSSPSKEVPLQVIPTGEVTYNMGISNLTINDNEDTSIIIYGPEEVLANIEYIPVYVDVEGLTASQEFKVQLEKPTDIKSMSISTVTVEVTLSNDIINKDMTDIGISHINLNGDYGVSPVDVESITVKLKGVTSVVNALSTSDIKATVDLQGLGVGTHEVDVVVTGTDPKVQYQSSVLKIKVKIFER